MRDVSIKFDSGFITANKGVSSYQIGRNVPSEDFDSKVNEQMYLWIFCPQFPDGG